MGSSFVPKLKELKTEVERIARSKNQTSKDRLVGLIDRLLLLVDSERNDDDFGDGIVRQLKMNSNGLNFSELLFEIQNVTSIILDKASQPQEATIVLESSEIVMGREFFDNKQVFIVHGHNDNMKIAVARFLHQLELDPIILNEQVNQGKAVIEKFLAYSNAKFAIVCMSGDDIGYSKKDGEGKAKERARQNVIFELGFFTGKLGRERVVGLIENRDRFEIPSDLYGTINIDYNFPDGNWRNQIAEEMIGCGYNLKLEKILWLSNEHY